ANPCLFQQRAKNQRTQAYRSPGIKIAEQARGQISSGVSQGSGNQDNFRCRGPHKQSMSHNWIMSVSGRAYGPYTALQMTAFAAQGRLIPASLVARTGQRQFSLATQDPEITAVLDSVREAATHAARKRTLTTEASSASAAGT